MQGALDSSGQPVDRDFYRTFWGLQAVFQQPYSILEPSAWASAVGSIRKVLAEFHKQVGPAAPPCCCPALACMSPQRLAPLDTRTDTDGEQRLSYLLL